ncbi:MAG: hypothetical protein E7556_06015 [Ruminococcaceae bacterium]|nr:hypothetical protein [Oscillospiraceae bacterium]
MYDDFYGNGSNRKWTFEEIDELLQDSGISSEKDFEPEQVAPVINKSESVDPRPVYNEDIEHKIKTTSVEKSGVDGATRAFTALESDKYRDRFLNKPMHNLQKTAEHKFIPAGEQPYERGGFVKKTSNFKSTKELEPIPILVSEDILREEQKREESTKEIKNSRTIGLRSLAVTDGSAEETELIEEDDMQLSFEGFNTEEEVQIVDEEEVERELIKKRRKKAAEFVVSTEPEEEFQDDDNGIKFGLDEYRNVNDKFKVEFNLKKQEKKALINTVICSVCFVLLVVLSLVASAVYAPNSLVHKNEFPVILLNFLVTLVACSVSKDIIVDGFASFKGLKFNRNSGCAVALVAVLLQNISFFFAVLPFENSLSLYSAVAVLPLVFNCFSGLLEARRLRKNFQIVTENELYSISHIERKETAFEIGRGLLLDEPIILASQKTNFPGRFLELSKKYYPSDELNKRTVPITFLVALVVGVITTVISRNAFNGLSSFTAVLAISAPCFVFLCDNLAINKLSAKLRKKGSVITGWEANRMCAVANGITVDSTDVFDKDGGNVFGIKTFHSMKVDDAILYTAAMVVASGGALGNLFRRVVMDRVELLPPVDTLAYEDKLGLSAWIQNRRVLVGSYDLLRNHNVEVPDKTFVEKYTHDGRYPLFLAIEGKLGAMFIVSYDVNQENAKLLKLIERESISLLLRNDDANITDNMVASSLSIPNSGIKVISAVSGDILNSYVNEKRTAADSVLMHNGKSSSYLHAVASALSLGKIKRSSLVLQTGAIAVGVAFAATFSFIAGGAELSIIPLIITQLVFSVIAIINTRMKTR